MNMYDFQACCLRSADLRNIKYKQQKSQLKSWLFFDYDRLKLFVVVYEVTKVCLEAIENTRF